MKKIILLFLLVSSIVFISGCEKKDNSVVNQQEDKENIKDEANDMNEITLKVNGRELLIVLEDNSSAKALTEKLKEKDITINAHDYGNFEKVGELGFSLPTNDQKITTVAGDVILYQGNQITVYYDTNTWNFTKLGKIKNISQSELKEILGDGNVELTFSLK